MTTKHKIILLSAFLMAGMIFAGCNKVKSLTKITVHPSFPVDIQVTIPPATSIMSTNSSYVFNDSVTIDPTTDTLVAKYKSYIISWQVDSITAIFTDVSKPINLSNLSLEIKPQSGESFGWQGSSLSVDNGTVLVVNNANGQLDKLGSVLNGTQPFKVVFSGVSDQDDVHFTLSVKINTTLVANPLGSV